MTARNTVFSQPMDNYSLNLGPIRRETRNFLIDTGGGSGSVQPVVKLLYGTLSRGNPIPPGYGRKSARYPQVSRPNGAG